jgi:hypothetical protein
MQGTIPLPKSNDTSFLDNILLIETNLVDTFHNSPTTAILSDDENKGLILVAQWQSEFVLLAVALILRVKSLVRSLLFIHPMNNLYKLVYCSPGVGSAKKIKTDFLRKKIFNFFCTVKKRI